MESKMSPTAYLEAAVYLNTPKNSGECPNYAWMILKTCPKDAKKLTE